MALIPMKDTSNIKKAGALDEWGQPTVGASTEYKCRIDEGTKLTRSQSGNEVVSNTQIMYEKVVAVDYDDEITWTDASGVQRTAKPIRVGYVKDFGGKVVFTEVEL